MDVWDRPNDFAGDDEYVTVQSQPDMTFAVRCLPQLTTGSIVSAQLANFSLQSDGPLSVTLGRREYRLSIESARTDQADAQIVLTEGGRRQVSIRRTAMSMGRTMTLSGQAI